MISLLAAVPEETRLIRQTCADLDASTFGGLEIWSGRCHGIPVRMAHAGIGKAAAAAAASTLLHAGTPEALWLFGCGGAFASAGLEIGDLAIADLEIFGDEGVATTEGFQPLVEMALPMRRTAEGPLFNAWPLDSALADWAAASLADHCTDRGNRLARGPFVTVSICTGTSDGARRLAARTNALCENMEGAAVALACHQHQVPLLELRGISNHVTDRQSGRWDLAAGMLAAQRAVLTLLARWGGR